jgi:hypothetical protein
VYEEVLEERPSAIGAQKYSHHPGLSREILGLNCQNLMPFCDRLIVVSA